MLPVHHITGDIMDLVDKSVVFLSLTCILWHTFRLTLKPSSVEKTA